MNSLIYWLGRAFCGFIGRLPLSLVAWLGRQIGSVVYLVDASHRRVALRNLTLCFGQEKSPAEIAAIARENFRRLGENYACTIKTYLMPWHQLQSRVEIVGADQITRDGSGQNGQSRIFALGHFGLFELFSHYGKFVPAFRLAATYRALRQPGVNRLMEELRNRSGCLFLERSAGGAELAAMMKQTGIILGLLCDHHAGSKGLRLPFLGHDCSVSGAPALYAMRYRCPLHVAVCYRTGLGRWRLEASPVIPTIVAGARRPVEDVMRDVNQIFETAVRRDPANWFWVHKRWKPAEARPAAPAPR